MAEYKLGDHKV